MKISFHLRQDADGYPPVAVEGLWANPHGSSHEYVIDSIPFFTCDATVGDRVVALPGPDGLLWFDHMVHRSAHSLVRVVFFDQSAEDSVARTFSDLGCGVEWMRQFHLLAIDIPPAVHLEDVQAYLKAQMAAGCIDYEEPILRQ
jgi:hypothetical protein